MQWHCCNWAASTGQFEAADGTSQLRGAWPVLTQAHQQKGNVMGGKRDFGGGLGGQSTGHFRGGIGGILVAVTSVRFLSLISRCILPDGQSVPPQLG